MKPRWMAGVGLAVGLGVAAWATAPQDSQEIKSLGDAATAIAALNLQVATLESRLEALENRTDDATGGGGSESSSSAAPAAAPAGSPVLKVEAIEAILPDEGAKARAQQLIIDAESLEQKAATQESSASSLVVDTRVGADDGSRQAAHRQMQSLRQEAGNARRLARQKREEAKQLTLPRQVIRGWSGKRSVEAYTDRDLSAALSKTPPGSFISGKWTLVDMDETSATVRVSSIYAVNKPATFVDRPAGSGK